MIKGQILEGSTFGKKINEVIQQYRPVNIVEIGTWKGLGSTLCIIKSMIENQLDTSSFISVESNLSFYNEAKHNLQDFSKYVQLIHGRLVDIPEVISFCNERKSNVNNNWLVEDLYNMSTNNNIFNQIPNEIDFLLLDGGEYSTYLEWKKLKGRTSIVALDDVIEMKTREINKELDNDSGYEQIILSNDRNGFAIYRKK